MRQTLVGIVLLALLLPSLQAQADPPATRSDDGSVRQVPATQTSRPVRTRLTDDEFVAAVEGHGKVHLTDAQLGLKDDARFRRACRLRLAGIILTGLSLSAVAGLGIVSIVTASDSCSDCGAAAAGFGILAGLSFLPTMVGVPLWVIGQGTINQMRQERRARLIPRLSLAAAPGAAAFYAGWQF